MYTCHFLISSTTHTRMVPVTTLKPHEASGGARSRIASISCGVTSGSVISGIFFVLRVQHFYCLLTTVIRMYCSSAPLLLAVQHPYRVLAELSPNLTEFSSSTACSRSRAVSASPVNGIVSCSASPVNGNVSCSASPWSLWGPASTSSTWSTPMTASASSLQGGLPLSMPCRGFTWAATKALAPAWPQHGPMMARWEGRVDCPLRALHGCDGLALDLRYIDATFEPFCLCCPLSMKPRCTMSHIIARHWECRLCRTIGKCHTLQAHPGSCIVPASVHPYIDPIGHLQTP